MPTNSPYYIVLNGPPQVGKSTIVARGLLARLQIFYQMPTVVESFAAPMKHFIATALGMKYSEMRKDIMLGVLQGYTPREFLIDLAERYMKSKYGEDIFGRFLEYRVLRIDPIPTFVIIDDGGFAPEVEVLGHNRRVIRITRPGHDFSKDSRGYLDDPHYSLLNDGSIKDLEWSLNHLAQFCIDQLPEKRRPDVRIV